LNDESEIKKSYLEAMNAANYRHNCMMFDEMSLREACNKIIHAEVVEPHFQDVENGSHEIDNHNWLSWYEAVEHSGDSTIPKPDPIRWKHLTNNVRLGGKKRGKQWWHLLVVPIFAEAISELLE
jgi:hypothetical protein